MLIIFILAHFFQLSTPYLNCVIVHTKCPPNLVRENVPKAKKTKGIKLPVKGKAGVCQILC